VRFIEVFMPADRLELARSSVSSLDTLSIWWEKLSDDQAQLHILAEAERSEEITDKLRSALADSGEALKIISLPVESSIPAPEETSEEGRKHCGVLSRKIHRVSREELQADVQEMMRTSWPNFMMTILSAVVCAVGLARSNIAIIIGAMVIAPLLGPNVGLALSVTLGDFGFIIRALRENLLRIGAALAFAFAVGSLFHIDPCVNEIASRTVINHTDIIVALAAGAAGALALSTGAPATLIGVMVATALMPPLVVTGMLTALGLYSAAFGSLQLLAVNLISINLAGVLTFLVMGFRPGSREDVTKAKVLVTLALMVWIAMLITLTLLILSS
ncbi:MAG: TIGR00341 family protein, partial [Candidatus Fermentibacteraceae bacterium]|nr:TIGR00341 family protein [Candidatus Fermentibacteraceae bacterium]